MSVLKAGVKAATAENGIIAISESCISSPHKRKTSAPCLKIIPKASPYRKISLPTAPISPITPIPAIKLKKSTGKISCCTNFGGYKKRAPEIKKANMYQLPDECTESAVDIPRFFDLETGNKSIEGQSMATLTATSSEITVIQNIPKPKVVIYKEELKRSSMKDKWGLKLVYQISQEGGLCLAVLQVTSLTAGHKAKLQPGDHVLTINGWKINSMDQPQVAANLFKAAGFSVVLRFQKSNLKLDGWDILDDF